MARRRESYNYSDKEQSQIVGISVILAIISAAMIGYSIIKSAIYGGNLELVYGLYGDISFLLSVFGLAIAIGSYKDENAKISLKYVGIISNSFLILLFIGLIILGFLGH